MPRFLAVYTMKPEDLARFRSLPKAEQNAIYAVGLKQRADWEARNAASFPDRGGMVGKTTRVTKDGIADAVNPFCGYICRRGRDYRGRRPPLQEPPAFHGLSRRRRGHHALSHRPCAPPLRLSRGG
jgi:hypothetical protein